MKTLLDLWKHIEKGDYIFFNRQTSRPPHGFIKYFMINAKGLPTCEGRVIKINEIAITLNIKKPNLGEKQINIQDIIQIIRRK